MSWHLIGDEVRAYQEYRVDIGDVFLSPCVYYRVQIMQVAFNGYCTILHRSRINMQNTSYG